MMLKIITKKHCNLKYEKDIHLLNLVNLRSIYFQTNIKTFFITKIYSSTNIQVH